MLQFRVKWAFSNFLAAHAAQELRNSQTDKRTNGQTHTWLAQIEIPKQPLDQSL